MRLVVDWDGTVTVRDSLVQVLHEFGDPALLAKLEPRVGVDLTLHEEIALEFQTVTAPLDGVVDWVVEHVEVRPGLREPYVYVGDGYSDLCAALAAERVFARDGLARYLDERTLPYDPFDDLHDVARQFDAN